MLERPTFSPFWHRIRLLKPRLRPHVQITRQHYRGRRWHILSDPTSNQFYRLNPIAYDFVGMLDGQRDIETAWKASLQKFGDAAPTQNELIQLIGQLHSQNLLSVDTTPETEQLLSRGRERVKKKATAQVIGIMYLKVKVFNPDRILAACEPILRPILNRWGFLAWCALLLYAAYSLLAHTDKLFSSFNQQHIFDPQYLWLIPVAFVITKAIHEFGHGILVKRFGGQVPEFGFMLLVFFPSPYVDASAAWAFPSKWQRIAVGAGGMMFELVVASVAALIWTWAQESGQGNDAVARLSYNILVSTSIATILFNANPLMRFDGYYMLSDFVETPNLAQRSNRQLLQYFQKYIYRMKNIQPVTTLPGEHAILTIYGLLAFAYRIFLFITITLFVLGQFFAIGIVLAIWTAAAWFLVPAGKFLHWLATNSGHSDHRFRSVAISIAMVALFAVLVGVIPMPDRRHGSGVIESTERTTLFFGTEGFVTQVHKRPGERVEAGEAIVSLENRDMQERLNSVRSQIDEFAISEREAIAKGDPSVAGLARERIRAATDNLQEVERRIAALVVRAPHAGVVAGDDPAVRLGAYVKRGDTVCRVVDPSSIRITATLDQRQAAWLFDALRTTPGATPLSCQIRLLSNIDTIVDAKSFEPVQAGQRVLPSSALGFVGGGQFETDTQDQSGRVARRPQFNVRIVPVDAANLAQQVLPGERVRVRFKLEPRPLLSQWMERLSKEIQGRVHL